MKHYDADLVAVDERYHFLCPQKFYTTPSTTGGKKGGYRQATNVDEATEVIYIKFICRFRFNSIKLRESIDLQSNCREDIVIVDSPNRG